MVSLDTPDNPATPEKRRRDPVERNGVVKAPLPFGCSAVSDCSSTDAPTSTADDDDVDVVIVPPPTTTSETILLDSEDEDYSPLVLLIASNRIKLFLH